MNVYLSTGLGTEKAPAPLYDITQLTTNFLLRRITHPVPGSVASRSDALSRPLPRIYLGPALNKSIGEARPGDWLRILLFSIVGGFLTFAIAVIIWKIYKTKRSGNTSPTSAARTENPSPQRPVSEAPPPPYTETDPSWEPAKPAPVVTAIKADTRRVMCLFGRIFTRQESFCHLCYVRGPFFRWCVKGSGSL